MRAPLATALAIASGLVVLLGYFLPVKFLADLKDIFLGWAVITAAAAALVGVIHLVTVHWRKMSDPQERDYYSPLLILAFILTVGAGLALGPTHAQFQNVVTSIQFPVEASLMAVLAISLAYASLRLLGRRRGLMGIVFVASVLAFLLLNSGLLASAGDTPGLKTFLAALQRLPLAGARGILLGIALGSLTAGVRVLMGADRPYSG